MMKQQYYKNPVSWVTYIVLFGMLLLGIAQIGWVSHPATTYITVQVEEGDTIWHLASLVTNNQTDVRSTVAEIVQHNDLSHNAEIRPGQVLQVPVPASDAVRIQAVLQKR